MTLAIGDKVPDFELVDTDGVPRTLSHGDATSATVIVFTCNHCPYALAWHDRIARAARDYADRGVRFLAINPNDSERYPRDSYAAMTARVARDRDAWPMPYLHDCTQAVARAYDAKTTPDVFVVDAAGRLRYRGAPDGDHDDESQDAAWLRDALDAVLDGRDAERAQTRPVGCSIKWKA
jgi:peroxiredoxin